MADDSAVEFLRELERADEAVAAVLAENRALYERSRDLGGKFYTISAVPMSHEDWKEHFQPFWGRLVSEKHKHDPGNVLGPGPGVFER